MAFFHIKLQSIASLISFTLTDDSQFYGLEISLSNILIIGNCNFKHLRDHTFMTSTWQEMSVWLGGEVLKFVTGLQIFLLSNKRPIPHFCRWGREGVQNLFLVAVINVQPLHGLKLQPIQSEAVVSFSTSSQKRDTFWLNRKPPTTSSFPFLPTYHSNDDQTKAQVTFSWH